MDLDNQLEHFSLRWNNFNDNMKSGFHDLLKTEDFVDVTIAAEGKLIQAHKMVLSVCSPYFKNIFKTNPCQHPVIFLKDVTHKELSGILQFMYLGEVSIQQEELGRFLKTAEALQIKGLAGEDKNECTDEVLNVTPENHKHTVKNKTKLVNNHEKEISTKKMKLSSFEDTENRNNQTSPAHNQSETAVNNENHHFIVCKTEPEEVTLSDEDDNVSIVMKEERMSESMLQLNESHTDKKNDTDESPDTPNLSEHQAAVLSGTPGDLSDSFISSEGNQEIRFVMSPRMRPCLVYNNYLYIKDHVGVAMPGQPKTIYWRCKDINCKARCIQTDFKFRLKTNTFHQHPPNVDPNYYPIRLKRAYDVIRYINNPESVLNL